MKINGNVIWITGASSGIGEALALECVNRGAKVIISARRENILEEVRSKTRHPENVKILPLDLEKLDTLNSAAEKAITLFGHVDILVNNGGLSQRSLTRDTSVDVDVRLMNVNYIGTVGLTKAILPHMLSRKALIKGQIVTVTSMVGKFGTPFRSTYAATKHALHGFMDSLRAEEENNGLKVTIVCPGFVNTNVSINALTGNGSAQGTMDSATEKGIDPSDFAISMANAIEHDKAEVYIAGAKEKLGLFLKRFFPSLYNRAVKKMAVT